MNISKLNRLSQKVTEQKGRKPIIVLERLNRIITNEKIDVNIHVENDAWTLTDEMKAFIDSLNKEPSLSVEEKIIYIYQKLCMDYTYDDNVLSYIKKVDEDRFELPDFYGKVPEKNWNQIRSQHNRRNCFEISRLLAKSLDTMLDETDIGNTFETCVLFDDALAHYLVGLICDEYCLTLDLDDFDKIKDLTRMKTNLTIEGITPIDDTTGKFKTVLDKFNSGRIKSSLEHINRIVDVKKGNSKDNDKIESIDSDDLQFIRYALEILKEQYNLDSAGIFEYMKEIVDSKWGSSSRKKVWTEVETIPGKGKRYTRCLVVDIGHQSYVIDVTADGVDQMLCPISKKDISNDPNSGKYLKYLHRDWEDEYDGR